MAKKRKKNRSLFTKYFDVNAIIIIICFVVSGIILTIFVSNYWQREKTSMLTKNANSTVDMMETIIDSETMQIRPDSTAALGKTLEALSDSMGVDADVFVSDLNGKPIVCRHKSKLERYQSEEGMSGLIIPNCPTHDNYLIPSEIIEEAKLRGYSATDDFGGVYLQNNYTVGIPVQVNEEPACIVFASMPISGLRTFVLDVLGMFLISVILALAIAFICIYVLIYQIIKPLRDMAEATKRFAKGDFSYRVAEQSDDELGELASAFNAMANSLDQLETSRRVFVSNVSHELKTPMTTIGGFIDGILDGTIPSDKQDYYLKIVSSEVKRLARLVTEMLNMSKIEAGELKINPVKFDMSKLLFEVLLSFEQKLEQKKVEIRGLDSIGPIVIEGDRDMLHQVVYNLIDNAVKFVNEGGYLQLSAEEKDDVAVVSIRNSGEGIAEEELNKIFERFYKVDKSRSLDVKSTGLGLFLVRNIIYMHGGMVNAYSELGEYSEFKFEIPIKFTN